jgi:hypothetical protein
MKARRTLAIVGVLLTVAIDAAPRERHVITRFIKAHGYPPGYVRGSHVVDHKWPLCDGGLDGEPNLQWMERRESYRKDIDERALCAQAAAFAKKWNVSR